MNRIETIYTNIKNEFMVYQNSKQAIAMSKYMKNKFMFYGIKTPVRRDILKKYKAVELNADEIISLANLLMHDEIRELNYAGLDILDMKFRLIGNDKVASLTKLIKVNSWWDTVDYLSCIIGKIIEKNYELKQESKEFDYETWFEINKNSDNLWLNRLCFVHMLKFDKCLDLNRVKSLCLGFSSSKEFFIQKASGWLLRQIARKNKQFVVDFVTQNENILAKLTVREAIKRIK